MKLEIHMSAAFLMLCLPCSGKAVHKWTDDRPFRNSRDEYI